mmetsp:Transcript_5948/g.19143  ORF Transcript_5948/g.19143 Transcript_5948/m.19143 type:complete len:946 (+) Transcript_5948:222-3059(+)
MTNGIRDPVPMNPCPCMCERRGGGPPLSQKRLIARAGRLRPPSLARAARARRHLVERLARPPPERHVLGHLLEDLLRRPAERALVVLCDARPLVAVVRVGGDAAAQHLLLLLGRAVLQLKGIVVPPRVAQIRVERDRTVAPRSRLLLLAVAPEEARDGEDDVRVVVARLERVGRLCLLLRALLHRNRLRPEQPRRLALLQTLGHQRHRRLAVSRAPLEPHCLEPQLRRARPLESCNLEQRTRLRDGAVRLLEPRRRQPDRLAVGAHLDGARERLSRGGVLSGARLELRLEEVQLPEAGVRLERRAEQREGALQLAQVALERHRLHPHALGARALARPRQQLARALWLAVLRLELLRGEPDLLRVRVRAESLVEDGARPLDVTRLPFLLCPHEPQHLRLRAVRHRAPQQRVERLARAVRLFVLRRAHPDRLLRREGGESDRVDGARALGAAARDERVRVLHPHPLPILLLDAEPDRLADDCLRRARRGALLARLRLGQPLLALEVHRVQRERFGRLLDDLVHDLEVAVGLLEPRGRDPDLRLSRDRLARLVEHLTRVLVRLEPREGQPHVDGVRHALDGAAEHDARVLRRLEVDGRLPQLDGVGHHLERLAQHAPPHAQVGLEGGGLQPDLDRSGDLLDRVGEDDLGVLGRLQPRRLEPHVFVRGAGAAALADDLPRGDELAGDLFEPRGGDPAGAVPGVGLSDRLEEEARLFDVANLRLGGDLDRVEVGEVALRVHHRLPRHRVRHLVELDRQHRVPRRSDGLQVRQRRRAARQRGGGASRAGEGCGGAADDGLHPAVDHLLRVERVVHLLLQPRLLEQRVGRRHVPLVPPLGGTRLAVLARLGEGLPLLARDELQLALQVAELVLQLWPHRAELVERLLQLVLAPCAPPLVHLCVHLGPDGVGDLVVVVVGEALCERLGVPRELVKVRLGEVCFLARGARWADI